MFSKSFEEVGLPVGHAFPMLAYHEPTRSLIAHTRPVKSELPAKRLSFRRVVDPCYQPIGSFPESISIESAVLDPVSPLLYFVTFEWHMREEGPGGDWEGLYRFDLEQHRCDRIADRNSLDALEGGWKTDISELLAVANDGKALICMSPRGQSRESLDYWVMRLDLANLRPTPITHLEAVFA